MEPMNSFNVMKANKLHLKTCLGPLASEPWCSSQQQRKPAVEEADQSTKKLSRLNAMKANAERNHE